eukprot:6202197-Pleurochrysis_carterae.AAC.1
MGAGNTSICFRDLALKLRGGWMRSSAAIPNQHLQPILGQSAMGSDTSSDARCNWIRNACFAMKTLHLQPPSCGFVSFVCTISLCALPGFRRTILPIDEEYDYVMLPYGSAKPSMRWS